MKKILERKNIKKAAIISLATITVVSSGIYFSYNKDKKNTAKDTGSYSVYGDNAGAVALISTNPAQNYLLKDSAGMGTVITGYTTQFATLEKLDTALSLLPRQTAEEPKKEEESKPVTSVVEGYTVLGVANVENYLNVRDMPSEDGDILGKLPMNAGCEILETLDGWYKVSSGELTGYVSADYLLTGEEANTRAKEALSLVAHVNADKLMVREEPNTDCEILTKVALDEEIEVAEQLDGWIKVNIDDVTGYVSADYVTVMNTLPKGVTLEQLSAETAAENGYSNTAVELIEYAKQFLGNPYVWGGTSLTNGADCSGFTMRIFEHFGYSLSRTSREQANNGTRVSLDEIKPGDLLFYNHGSTIGHVAIYIGNGQIIHASTERTGIIIGNAFYTTPACATRIIN